jgi:hypothetical protein
VVQVVKHLPNKIEALSSNPCTAKKKNTSGDVVSTLQILKTQVQMPIPQKKKKKAAKTNNGPRITGDRDQEDHSSRPA